MIWINRKSSLIVVSVTVISLLAWISQAKTSKIWKAKSNYFLNNLLLADSIDQDTTKNKPYIPSKRPFFRPDDRMGDPFSNKTGSTPLQLPPPSNINLNVTMDDSLRYYNIYENMGDLDYRNPSMMTFEEYSKYQQQQAIRNYWKSKAAGLDGESALTSKRIIPRIYISPMFDRIFGGNYVDIRPNGNVTLKFGARFNRNYNPTIPIRQQRVGDFDFQQNITLNLIGKVGEKLKLTFNWDTKASFDFENNMKLEYTGYEEEIIRKIEAGNVSLPLNNSLITGAQNLFGIKTQLQFGRLGVTTITSNMRGTTDEVLIQNGGQYRNFEIKIDQYDKDRHFFLSQYFRDRYDAALENLPLVNSGIVVRRLEVYVTNTNRATENIRNVVALMDIGEPKPFLPNFGGNPNAPASNTVNSLFSTVASNPLSRSNNQVDNYLSSSLQLTKGVHFEHVQARKLDPKEYTFNPQLGYISLKTTLLPEQVLAVSYEYTFNGKNYKVGELLDDYQNLQDNEVIFMKLLKATNPSLRVPTWDLMMKNVYSLNASQINRQNFQLNLIYKDDETGVDINSLKEGRNLINRPLVEVFNLDNVNSNNDRPSDGNFDFLPGITIDPDNGKIIFTKVEPFGNYLETLFIDGEEENLKAKYVYNELYDSTQSDAQQFTSKNKFFLKGRFQSTSTDEISLPGFRVAEGSVVVYSGGTQLIEGTDYQVFYDLGRVKILNPSYLNNASDLRVTFEKANILNIQPRTLVGSRFDYRISDDLNFGATLLHLQEQPIINRVNIGDEPTNNTIYGLDANFRRDSRFITKMVDKLPLLETKVPSTVTFSTEFAQLLPGRSQLRGEDGVSYIDDFEGAETPYTLGGFGGNNWRLAATPFTIGGNTQGLRYNDRRARLAWYTIDQTYYSNSRRPGNLTTADLENHYVRGVKRREVFPNRDLEVANSYEYTFDLAYYPSERGQYNYNPNTLPDGTLPNPSSNFGGISRGITFDTDFDNANIEYMEFWMMDPFITGKNGRKDAEGNLVQNNTGGQLVLNLGSVSEDLIKDQRYSFENGLPTSNSLANVDVTDWGRVSRLQFLTDAFDNTPGARQFQDIGLDGINDADEKIFFPDFSNFDDPSNDNFRHHLDPLYDDINASILRRYKQYNGMENNSAENSTLSAYALPDKEDLNRDNIISDIEQYYEYNITLQPGQPNLGSSYVVDQVVNTNINGDEVSWYQFRVPIRQPDGIINGINGFKSMRFMRMYLTDFAEPVVLRLVQFQFIANQWRKFLPYISEGSVIIGDLGRDVNSFTVSTVNIEENGSVVAGITPYILPPGIERQKDYTSNNNRRQNEQSLQVCVDGLKDSFSKAVYKNINLDMLIYKRLKMFIHAEARSNNTQDGDVNAFIRLGTDYSDNYYEYTVPLQFTPVGATTEGEIWPASNLIDVAFEEFVRAKVERNSKGIARNVPYTTILPNGKSITIKGNPDLSTVLSFMIGIQNPISADNADHSVCIWADELRVSDFDNEAGWAATARLNTKLADLANVTATGSYTTYGFGGIQQKIAQRTRENTGRVDLNANITLDKFIPEKAGLRVPMAVQYGKEESAPRFDPLEGDIPLEQSLERFDNAEDKQEYRREVVEQTTNKSISFINVRKEKTDPKAKPHIYDVENLSFSYAYSERLFTNIVTDRDFTQNYTGAVAYTYTNTPKNYAPLSKISALNSPFLRLIKDLNFTPAPSRLSFRADLDRRYNELFLQRRDPFSGKIVKDATRPTFMKSFYFNRIYDLKWDISRSLIFDYTATNRAVVDEPDGQVNDAVNEVIWQNLKRLGRTTNFDQNVALTYRLPLDKFPLTDWVSADTRYQAGYTWTAGSTALNQDTTFKLGNTIQNNTEASVAGKVDLVKLYNKVKFLNSINNPPRKQAAPVRPTPQAIKKPDGSAAEDTTKKKPELKALKSVLRVLMTARSVNFNYSLTQGTLLPGYLPRTKFFGFEEGFDAPGAEFILGRQYDLDNLFNRAYSNGWYTESSEFLQTPLSNIKTHNFRANTMMQPFKNFNIQFDATRNKSNIREVLYKSPFDTLTGNYFGDPVAQNPIETGSFSISFISVRTLFESDKDNRSAAFQNFIDYRRSVRDKLTDASPFAESDTTLPHYGLNSQEVLIPAFVNAYSGKDINSYDVRPSDPFIKIPLPNWRVDYNGLSQLDLFKKYFSSFTLSHSYASTYNITSFTTSLEYNKEPAGYSTAINNQVELIPYYIVNQVTIQERMAPLLGINFKTKNQITTRLEYKTERNLSLNLTNAQITQTNVKDYVIGIGYTTNKFRVPFRINGERKVLNNDLTMRLDLTVRDNETLQRSIIVIDESTGEEAAQTQATNGSLQFQLRPTIDYVVNQRLNLQFYFIRNITDPKVDNSYKTTLTEGGIQLRYSLSQ